MAFVLLQMSIFALGGNYFASMVILLTAVVAPIVVNAVSHSLEKLFDEWLDNRHRTRRHDQRKRKKHKRR